MKVKLIYKLLEAGFMRLELKGTGQGYLQGEAYCP